MHLVIYLAIRNQASIRVAEVSSVNEITTYLNELLGGQSSNIATTLLHLHIKLRAHIMSNVSHISSFIVAIFIHHHGLRITGGNF